MNESAGTRRVPAAKTLGMLAAKGRSHVAEPHPALIRSRGVTDHPGAGAKRGSVVSELNLALVRGRAVAGHLGAGAKRGSVISELNLALVRGRGITNHFIPELDHGHRSPCVESRFFDCDSQPRRAPAMRN